MDINFIDPQDKNSYTKYLKRVLKLEDPVKARGKRKQQRSWYPFVSNMLISLTKLDDLTLNFGYIDWVENKFGDEFLRILDRISEIRSIKVLEFSIPFDEFPNAKKPTLIKALENFREVISVTVDLEELAEDEWASLVEEVVDQVNNRQSLRCDLMF